MNAQSFHGPPSPPGAALFDQLEQKPTRDLGAAKPEGTDAELEVRVVADAAEPFEQARDVRRILALTKRQRRGFTAELVAAPEQGAEQRGPEIVTDRQERGRALREHHRVLVAGPELVHEQCGRASITYFADRAGHARAEPTIG